MAKLARVGVVIMSVAMVIPAVVAELSRGGSDYSAAPVSVPIAPPDAVATAPAATESAIPEQAPQTASKILAVPSILVGGGEFSQLAARRRAVARVHAQKQLAARAVPASHQFHFRRQVVAQQPIMDPQASQRLAQNRQVAAAPLYVVQEQPQRRGWRTFISHIISGMHDRWVSLRSRSAN